jgi:DNA polymerase-3 subunit alpha
MQLSETWLRQLGVSPVEAVAKLKSLLEPASGGDCEVRLRYRRLDAEVALRLGVGWRIKPTDGFLRQAQRLLGAEAVSVRFRPPPAAVASGRTAGYARSG